MEVVQPNWPGNDIHQTIVDAWVFYAFQKWLQVASDGTSDHELVDLRQWNCSDVDEVAWELNKLEWGPTSLKVMAFTR